FTPQFAETWFLRPDLELPASSTAGPFPSPAAPARGVQPHRGFGRPEPLRVGSPLDVGRGSSRPRLGGALHWSRARVDGRADPPRRSARPAVARISAARRRRS